MTDPMNSQIIAGEAAIRVPSFADLEDRLREIATEAAATAGTERGERCFERLVPILMRPALRIARCKLEDLLRTRPFDPDDAEDVAALAFMTLYRIIHTYQPGAAVIPWFATMVRSRAIDFVRQKYHTRAKLEMVPLGQSALVVPAPAADDDSWMSLRETIEQLPPDLRQVADLIGAGYGTREIAEITHETVVWVRARKRELREELAALR